MLIRDIPKIKETVEGVKQLKSFKTALPLLKPFLRLFGVSASSVEESLAQIEDLESKINEMSLIPDRFNDLFASRGWILYELMDLEVAKQAIGQAEAGDFQTAEAVLLDYFDVQTVGWQLKTMLAVEAFHPRMRLAELALLDYENERYHACIPVILAQIDGLVNELHEKRRGFFSKDTDLEAWDSIAAHNKGLNQLAGIFRKGRYKTTTEPITIPFRNGILHGMDLGYDNRMVAAKSWAALFAVREWAIKAERDMLNPPPKEPEKSLKQTLAGIAYHIEEKKRWENWTPRLLRVGDDIPANATPDDLEIGTPERALAEFLGYWKKSNYGYMAKFMPFIFRKYAEKPPPALMREAYNDIELISYVFKSFEHTVAAISEIGISLELKINDNLVQRDFIFRMTCENEQGDVAAHGNPKSKWVVMNWNKLSS